MAQNDNILFENARILFRNFSGKPGQYNEAGKRNFAVALDPDQANEMRKIGFSVGQLSSRDDGEAPQDILRVKVDFGGRPPRCVMITSKGRTFLDEETVDLLDWADMSNVDLLINPYHHQMNGGGVAAYLQSIYVTIEEDELERKYADVPLAEGSADPMEIAGAQYAELEAGEDPSIVDAEIVGEG